MDCDRKAANAPDSKKKKERGKVVSDKEKERLFQLYVIPNLTSIKTLTVKYTDKYQDVEDNYNYTLAQMYSYIYSYDSEKSLDTWIHIVTKRACFNQNKKRAKYNSIQTDMECCTSETLHQYGTANIMEAGFGTLSDNISDTMYRALLKIPPRRLSPFLLYSQGIGVRDITQMEWQAGHLEKKSEDVVKSRIFWAKKQLQYILKKDGISKASYASARSH